MRNRRSALLGVAILATALALTGCLAPPPLGSVGPQPVSSPKYPVIGDPTVLADGTSYYIFGSNSSARLPVAVVSSLDQVYPPVDWFSATKEAMPARPAWAGDDALWAPTVARFGSRYVLFFAANRIGAPNPANRQCIGRAFASAPGGPYAAEPAPFSCGLDGFRGALDPSIFFVPDGRIFLYAAFSDTPNSIYTIALDANGDPTGRRPDGQASYWGLPILYKQFPWEGRFLENPSMTYDASTKTYLLAYSAGDWWTPSYSTGLARCSTPIGLCTSNPNGPWLASGNGRTGVGGLSFFTAFDGSTKAIFASFTQGQEGTTQIRAGSVASVGLGSTPQLSP
jgi:glycosyl hydrolase family 43